MSIRPSLPEKTFNIFGFLLGCYALIGIITEIRRKYINPKTRILLTLTEKHVVFPIGTQHEETEELRIPWDDLERVHFQDYRIWPKRSDRQHESSGHHYEIFFLTKKLEPYKTISIDPHLLDISVKEFFEHIRKFYKGPIVKEYKNNKYQYLTQIGHEKHEWSDSQD